MSKVESSEVFTVDASLNWAWDFFKDLSNIGQCIPGCEEVRSVQPRKALFKIKLKVGYISKTITMDVSVTDSKPPQQLVFKGASDDARIVGRLDLVENGSATQLRYSLSIEATSALARTAITFMGKDFVRTQTQLFAECV